MNETNIIGAFSEEQAAQLTGISINQLRRWDKDGFFNPAFGTEQRRVPYGRVYSFRDIVSLRVLNALRNEEKIPLSHLRKVSDELAHLGDERWTASTLFVLGKRVVIRDGQTSRRREVVSGQLVLNIPLKVVIASTRKAVEELNDREAKVGKIVHSRFVAQNEAVLSGTRITVASIQGFSSAGYSVAEILREFPDLQAADIAAAIAYNGSRQAA